VEKTWRHLNFWQYKSYIHMRTPRTDCPECGKLLWVPPWGRPESGFTMLFEAFIMVSAKKMPVEQIGKLVGEHDTRLWRTIRFHVERSYGEKDFSSVTEIGCDETSSRKGHKYITVFADMNTGEVLFATPGKDSATVKAFAEELPKHGAKPEQIKEATIDMSPAFISGFESYLFWASITFDKFHVIQALNKVQDEVRRMEQKYNSVLKYTRYIWLKNPENLTEEQSKLLGTLRNENLKTAKVYQMKLTLQDIYRNIWDPEEARVAFEKWLGWAFRSRLEPVIKFAKMVKSHFAGIMRYFTSRPTTGAMEGLNSRIQGIKRRARGFRNNDNFIAVIYLEAGGLNFGLPKF
jgi:transposase